MNTHTVSKYGQFSQIWSKNAIFVHKSAVPKFERNVSESRNRSHGEPWMALESWFLLRKVGKTKNGSRVRAKTPIISNFGNLLNIEIFSIKLVSNVFCNDI